MAIDRMQSDHGFGVILEKLQTAEREEVPSIKLENIVGLDDQAKKLIGSLMEETEELDVISIVGMPGLGKTTLASMIYRHPTIEYEFPTRIWVHVSHEFNRRNVLLNVLKQLTEQDNSHMTDDELVQKVFDFLSKIKFLIVMDDVWTAEDWDSIQDALPKKNKMGKVLITSRSKEVGLRANRNREPHMLRFLTNDESWALLQLQVFGWPGNCPIELISIGKRIAEQCDGLPLAIMMVGSILVVGSSTSAATYLTRQWWEKVSENLTTYMREFDRDSMLLRILEMSYNKLPVHLRDCFLYLGVFPRDYKIPVRTLTRLWIAEGFIQDNGRKSLEEQAVENLHELIDSNMLIVEKKNSFGENKTCRVHDTIHGLCKSKAAEQYLFQEMKMSEEGVFATSASSPAPNYSRRLCIHSHLSEFLSAKPYGPTTHSLLCFYKEPILLDPKDFSAIHKSFNLLRLLESNSIKFTKFPKNLTKLMHLKHISLSCDDLKVLPKTLSKLWNLQTLVVDTQSPSLVIKANIWKMTQLRHLITKAAIILDRQPKGEVACKKLLTLSRLSPKYCTESVFERAPNLKELGIRGELATHLDFYSLRKLRHLENLKLVNDLPYNESAPNSYKLHRFDPNCFPLRRLTISGTYLAWEQMSILGKIQSLKFLKLKNNAFTGSIWATDADGFARLEFLFIGSTDLVSWEASSADCFPRLNCLVLRNCGKLKAIPLCLAKSLKTLDIDHVSSSVAVSARKIQKEAERMRERGKGSFREFFRLSVGPGCER